MASFQGAVRRWRESMEEPRPSQTIGQTPQEASSGSYSNSTTWTTVPGYSSQTIISAQPGSTISYGQMPTGPSKELPSVADISDEEQRQMLTHPRVKEVQQALEFAGVDDCRVSVRREYLSAIPESRVYFEDDEERAAYLSFYQLTDGSWAQLEGEDHLKPHNRCIENQRDIGDLGVIGGEFFPETFHRRPVNLEIPVGAQATISTGNGEVVMTWTNYGWTYTDTPD